MSYHNDEEIRFQIQRVYTKDISFEAPDAVRFFYKQWEPDVKLDLNTISAQLDDKIFEVVLRVTVITSVNMETVFLCEVQQAGIFLIKGVEGKRMSHFLGSYCPNILFPYARECVTSLVSRATFPPLNLAPVNFDALFMNYIKEQADGIIRKQDVQ